MVVIWLPTILLASLLLPLPLIQRFDPAMSSADPVVAVPVGTNRIKHVFVFMHLHPRWLQRTNTISVYELLQISFNGGPWHGWAVFHYDEVGGARWIMTFHYDAVDGSMQFVMSTCRTGTSCFLNVQDSNPGYNSILIPTDDAYAGGITIRPTRHSSLLSSEDMHTSTF